MAWPIIAPVVLAALKAAGAGAATAAGAYGTSKLLNKIGSGKGKKARPGSPQAAQQGQQIINQPGNGLTGNPAYTQQFPRFTPEQQSAFGQVLQSGLGQLGQPQYNPGEYKWDFNPIAEEARSQFQNKTIPSILERLTGSGGFESSALGHQLGQAGHDLERSLASLGAQYGLQNRGQEAQIGLQNQALQNNRLMSLLNFGGQQQFESAYFPKQPGFAQTAGTELASSFAEQIPKYLIPAIIDYWTKSGATGGTQTKAANATVTPMNATTPYVGRSGMPLSPTVSNTINQIGRS